MYNAVIVDDDRWAIADIRRSFALPSYGFDLAGEYTNAEDALEAVLRLRPDIVITDICMEGGSGLDLIRICREKGIESLFIIISGHDKFSYAQEAVNQGAFYYMLKPVDDTEAHEVLRRAYLRLSEKKPASDVKNDDTGIFDNVLEYVRTHYADTLSLEELALHFYLNKNYLSEMFTRRISKTFVQYKNTLRIAQAKKMLSESNRSINDIAGLVGYDDTGYFSRVFKQITGVTPLQFRMGKDI